VTRGGKTRTLCGGEERGGGQTPAPEDNIFCKGHQIVHSGWETKKGKRERGGGGDYPLFESGGKATGGTKKSKLKGRGGVRKN